MIFCVLASFASSICGQESQAYKSKLLVESSYGGCVPITRLLKGNPTDYVAGYNDSDATMHISFTYFFSKRFGVSFSLESRLTEKSFPDFSGYEDRYYIPKHSYNIDYSYPVENPFSRILFGITYRIEIRTKSTKLSIV